MRSAGNIKRCSVFTLVELVLALGIFTLITLTVVMALHTVISTREKVSSANADRSNR
jgi:type II secretory pathway component PulJ